MQHIDVYLQKFIEDLNMYIDEERDTTYIEALKELREKAEDILDDITYNWAGAE